MASIHSSVPQSDDVHEKVVLFSILGLGCVIPPAQADLPLAVARNCMACHSVERKVVGPSFRDSAARYREDKGAVERLARKIVNGGGDAWGVVKMPANPQVSEEEARRLAAWVLSLK